MADHVTAKGKIPASIENRLGGFEGQSGSSGDIKITSVVWPLTLTSDRYPYSWRDSYQQPPATERPQTHTFDRTGTGPGHYPGSARVTAIASQI